MARPGLRAMRVLPVLEERRAELEKCVFCPKLCRSACPVSNADTRETVTPWGKMSLAWMTAHGDVPLDASHAAPSWACTGCMACRESCDHRNDVTGVLYDARDAEAQAAYAAHSASGEHAHSVIPAGARRALDGFSRHDDATRRRARELAGSHPRVRADARDALLVGCGYLRDAPREARDVVDAATALSGEPVALVEGCCGLPLRMAGDKAGFAPHAESLARTLAAAGVDRITVADAGCALALRRHYAEAGVALAPRVELLVEQAAAALPRMTHVPHEAGPVRWHDPCQLGRGLGVYEAPRAVLGRILGRAPDEFHVHARREHGVCSGAGGLLPVTMPEVAKDIAASRIASHEESGGGHVVTACASSLVALRKAAASAASAAATRTSSPSSSVAVDDLASWIARALHAR
ncbi:MAG TPA: (Fe-S)-binding protein [Polyangiaceae bacterium]|jgi:Fe-S oxidoreductase